MAARASSSSAVGLERELMCSRCYKRESCIQCCGTRFCLRHFHTTDHSSDHPERAFVMNRAAFDQQLPAFQEMWREAFQSVADEVDRISREVGKRVADDPLASIGMSLPRKISSAERGKAGSSQAAKPSASRRRPRDDKDADEAAARDPFARRKTRPKTYWAVKGDAGASAKDGASAGAAASSATGGSGGGGAAAPRKGEYQCELCSSDNTSFDIIGGSADGTRKGETYGKKDGPELILRVVCHACGNNWLEER